MLPIAQPSSLSLLAISLYTDHKFIYCLVVIYSSCHSTLLSVAISCLAVLAAASQYTQSCLSNGAAAAAATAAAAVDDDGDEMRKGHDTMSQTKWKRKS